MVLVVKHSIMNLIGWKSEEQSPKLSDKDLSNIDLVKATLAQITKKSGKKSYTAKILTLVSNCPVLQWKDSYKNRPADESYIDNIHPSDMKESVMRGVDRLKRPFVALKVRDEDGGIGVETFFQRNAIDPSFWTSGGEKFKNYSSLVHEYVTDKEFDIFQKLINGEEVSCSGFKDCKSVSVKVQLVAANKVQDQGDFKS